MRLLKSEREKIARRRIVSVLETHTLVNLRTLEQKISDAGPNPQRVQPHVLTPVKNALTQEGRVIQFKEGNQHWIHLDDADPKKVAKRLDELLPVWRAFTEANVVKRTGQALEIAIFRGLLEAPDLTPIGGFANLDSHDDSKLYTKQELHNFNGKTLGKEALDFIVECKGAYCGIEAKNVRAWLYPHDKEIRAAIRKAQTIGVVPVIIARRIPYVSFLVLGACGVIMHETYNQRMAQADEAIAAQAKAKELLGYHDIKIGNLPDARLTKFLGEKLPDLIGNARIRLAEYSDLLEALVDGEMAYAEFAARVRRRRNGQKEDNDWYDEVDESDPYDY